MTFFPVLAFTDADRWRPGIGDPTVMGWLTVMAYALAAVLCLRAAFNESRARSRFLFWSVLGGIMVLLGINKQLDLQTWLTLAVRKVAISEGIYEDRRLLQFAFILCIALAGMIGFVVLWRFVHREGADLRLPLLGIFLVICFVIIRAASFHHIDRFLKFRLAGMRMNWVLELAGIGIIVLGALRRQSQTTRSIPA